jgi:thiamine biosynthesis protein ThiI
MLFIVRYGELGLKSKPVRKRWQNLLLSNITDSFLDKGIEFIHKSEWGRIYIQSSDEAGAMAVLQRTFGVVSFSPVVEGGSGMEHLKAAMASYAVDNITDEKTFCVRARRSGKHDYTSQDLERDLGAAVLDAMPELKVKLTKPDITLQVEVRGKRSYIFHEKMPGPGGLPLGTGGKVLAWVDNMDSAVAAWMLMKRGCRAHIVGVGSKYIDALRAWDLHLRVHEPTEGENAAFLIQRHGIEAVVKGLRIVDFETKQKKNELGLPTFYPVIGLAEDNIERYWSEITR